MATLSLTTHFTVDIPDNDTHTLAGGSTTSTDSITVTHYFDKRYSITNSSLTEIWNDTMLADFDFMWVDSDQAVELQLMCNEGGSVSSSNLENAFVVKLIAGVPFVLADDASRNRGDVTGTFNESNYVAENDTWESNWTADTIDRIECYNASGSTANVRVFAAT
jgi:hypothetical protein